MWCFWLSYQFHHYNHHQWHEHLALDSHYHLVITKYKTNVITQKSFLFDCSALHTTKRCECYEYWKYVLTRMTFDSSHYHTALSFYLLWSMTIISIRKTKQCTFFLQLNDFDKYLKNYIPIGFPLLFICHDLPKKFLGLYKCLIIAIEL